MAGSELDRDRLSPAIMILLMPCGSLLVSRIWLRSGPGSPDLQKKTVRTLKHNFTVQIVLVFQRNPCQHKTKSRKSSLRSLVCGIDGEKKYSFLLDNDRD